MTPEPTNGPVTQLLDAFRQGDAGAHEQLWSAIYGELRSMAGRQMEGEPSTHTLQPTALVHEAYIKLIGSNGDIFANRKLFFAAAAKIMREICVDYARKRKCLKRGGGERPGRLYEESAIFDEDPTRVLAIDEALDRLKRVDPRKAELVVWRYFAGLKLEESAEALGIAKRTASKEWRLARAWLHRELSRGDSSVCERKRR